MKGVSAGEISGASASDLHTKLKALYVKKISLSLSVLRSSADVPVIFYFMNYTQVSQKWAGFCGTISSSVSLYNLYGKA